METDFLHAENDGGLPLLTDDMFGDLMSILDAPSVLREPSPGLNAGDKKDIAPDRECSGGSSGELSTLQTTESDAQPVIQADWSEIISKIPAETSSEVYDLLYEEADVRVPSKFTRAMFLDARKAEKNPKKDLKMVVEIWNTKFFPLTSKESALYLGCARSSIYNIVTKSRHDLLTKHFPSRVPISVSFVDVLSDEQCHKLLNSTLHTKAVDEIFLSYLPLQGYNFAVDSKNVDDGPLRCMSLKEGGDFIPMILKAISDGEKYGGENSELLHDAPQEQGPSKRRKMSLSREVVLAIYNEAHQTQSSYHVIAEKFNTNVATVHNIANKVIYKQYTDNIDEPVQTAHGPKYLDEITVRQIFLEARDSKSRYTAVARKFNTNATTVTRIAQGKSYRDYTQDLLDCPHIVPVAEKTIICSEPSTVIDTGNKGNGKSLKKKNVREIFRQAHDPAIDHNDIARKFNIQLSTVSNIADRLIYMDYTNDLMINTGVNCDDTAIPDRIGEQSEAMNIPLDLLDVNSCAHEQPQATDTSSDLLDVNFDAIFEEAESVYGDCTDSIIAMLTEQDDSLGKEVGPKVDSHARQENSANGPSFAAFVQTSSIGDTGSEKTTEIITKQVRFTPELVHAIYKMGQNLELTYIQIAEKFKVHKNTVMKICKKEIFRHYFDEPPTHENGKPYHIQSSKLTRETVRAIFIMGKNPLISYTEIGKQFNCSAKCVSSICNRQAYKYFTDDLV